MTTKRIPIDRRFWPKVLKAGPDECWLWTGAVAGFGHGRIGRGGHRGGAMCAHRLSWEIHNGPVPDGLCVLHRCDVPTCVNPSHLFLGTRPENMADMTAKGRRASKITAGQAAEIRASTDDALSVSKRYGVSRILVYHIRNGRIWKGASNVNG